MTREAAAHELVVSAVAYLADMAWDEPDVVSAARALPRRDWQAEAAKIAGSGVSPYSRLYAARLAWHRHANA